MATKRHPLPDYNELGWGVSHCGHLLVRFSAEVATSVSRACLPLRLRAVSRAGVILGTAPGTPETAMQSNPLSVARHHQPPQPRLTPYIPVGIITGTVWLAWAVWPRAPHVPSRKKACYARPSRIACRRSCRCHALPPPKSILLFYTILKYYTILKGIYSSSVYSAFEAALLQSPTAPPPHCPTHR